MQWAWALLWFGIGGLLVWLRMRHTSRMGPPTVRMRQTHSSVSVRMPDRVLVIGPTK